METTVAVSHGIVFVYDPTQEDVEVPGPGEPTAFNSSAISVITLAEVDGEVTLRLVDEQSPREDDSLRQVFEGTLKTPGRSLAVHSVDPDHPLLQIAVRESMTKVTVFVDDLEFPSVVEVRLVE